jgi:hypothetical protein
MNSVKKQDICTRERLLAGACEIFTKKGYRDATIADICERAGANVAAVNYHFGDKETLYIEEWPRWIYSPNLISPVPSAIRVMPSTP